MKTIAEVLTLGLKKAEEMEKPHETGMCVIISRLRGVYAINQTEFCETHDYLAYMMETRCRGEVYLYDYLAKYIRCKDNSEVLTQWRKWYEDCIAQLNQEGK